MTIREAILEGVELLRERGVESPFLDASLLLSQTLSIDTTTILRLYPDPCPAEVYPRYQALLSRRLRGEPVAYIRGRREFRGLDFKVDSRVLVPRPETEHLVEAALAAALSFWADNPGSLLRLHDCCTGSGCVAISLAKELAAARPSESFEMSCSDISPAALELACLNAQSLLGQELVATLSDLFTDIAPGEFHIITANPPYLSADQMGAVAMDLKAEPPLALDGGADGLDIYRRLAPQAHGRLIPGGSLFLEIGADQGPALVGILREAGFSRAELHKDLAGRHRVAIGGRHG